MTATLHGGESPVSAAARLLRGGGVMSVATTAAAGDPASLGPALHGMSPCGTLLLLLGPQGATELDRRRSRTEVIVMIDDFAPIVEVKVHVGSLRTRGRVRAVAPGQFEGHPLRAEAEMWPGSRLVAVEAHEVTVTRLGITVDLATEMLADAEVDPVAGRSFEIVEAVMAELGRDVGALIEAEVGTRCATEAHLLAVDRRGLHVLTRGGDGAMCVHRIPFCSPATQLEDVVTQVALLRDTSTAPYA